MRERAVLQPLALLLCECAVCCVSRNASRVFHGSRPSRAMALPRRGVGSAMAAALRLFASFCYAVQTRCAHAPCRRRSKSVHVLQYTLRRRRRYVRYEVAVCKSSRRVMRAVLRLPMFAH